MCVKREEEALPAFEHPGTGLSYSSSAACQWEHLWSVRGVDKSLGAVVHTLVPM